jgi:indole-3-glycerol phosphate synthase
MSADLLATIVAATKRIVDVRESHDPLPALAERAAAVPALGGRFREALMAGGRINIIAECKRRSPSRGVLRADYDPAAIASGYAAAGAAAISVLTEPAFFDGSLAHLAAVRATVAVPLLRKDFIVSEYQLHEARLAGADAVLLIVAALPPAQLQGATDGRRPTVRTLHERAADLGLDALVEVHDASELQIAVDAGARIIGVNNRNLRTLAVDVHASETLIGRMPAGVVAVSESGLRTADDVIRLKELGYQAFLIGERLMTADDPGAMLRTFMRAGLKTGPYTDGAGPPTDSVGDAVQGVPGAKEP